jgi:hypothetical protein
VTRPSATGATGAGRGGRFFQDPRRRPSLNFDAGRSEARRERALRVAHRLRPAGVRQYRIRLEMGGKISRRERGQRCRSVQEPSLTIRSVVDAQPVTNGCRDGPGMPHTTSRFWPAPDQSGRAESGIQSQRWMECRRNRSGPDSHEIPQRRRTGLVRDNQKDPRVDRGAVG